MVAILAIQSFKCARFDMCSTSRTLILLVTGVVLIGARGEVGFREFFESATENNGSTSSNFNANSNTTLTNNGTTWTYNNATSNTTWNANSTSSSNVEGRIIGGQIAWDRSQFAFQASLRQRTSRGSFHFCGATIIDQQHLLSAAHCVVSENGVVTRASAIFSVVGDLNVAQANFFTVQRSISHVFTHPNYNPRTIQHDVAVLRVSPPFDAWTTFINPLPMPAATPPGNTNCTVSGWGVTETGFASDLLRFVSVPIVPLQICRAAYGNALLSGMICAGFMQGGRDACQGDSGGPLVCLNSVAGVVSWGYECAQPGFPGVYADVATYRNWIIQQTQRSSSETKTFSVFTLFLALLSAVYSSS